MKVNLQTFRNMWHFWKNRHAIHQELEELRKFKVSATEKINSFERNEIAQGMIRDVCVGIVNGKSATVSFLTINQYIWGSIDQVGRYLQDEVRLITGRKVGLNIDRQYNTIKLYRVE